ncbi:EscI/YscI/HrpB family type III secretion system inner rod protein [Serratia rubidaea]|uniref:AraC family transcriptional regulator n=1 Tax=Serratia rubidaea TaxID=61652 RepID=A0ABS0MD93_SERRU|nr:EscI/YscI/HrpB family type III secretion system inner rod protein [Serratia rubidaea]MBH1930344.1 AraC family transcriptional regulator [Serratia rubidaea]MDC6117442.1 EscI/YscI/HrpB family type III secretion system inner rod protein [Serratia rubidaea]
MKIPHNGPSLAGVPLTTPAGGVADANQDDMHAFSAALNAPAGDGQENLLSGLGGAISDNQRAQQQAFRNLEVASRSSNPTDFSQANAALSDYYIQSLMNAKIIAKGTQTLDKLTNLQ